MRHNIKVLGSIKYPGSLDKVQKQCHKATMLHEIFGSNIESLLQFFNHLSWTIEHISPLLTFSSTQNINNFNAIKMNNNTTTCSTWYILHFICLHGDLNATECRHKWYHDVKSRPTSCREQRTTLMEQISQEFSDVKNTTFVIIRKSRSQIADCWALLRSK